MPFRLRISGVEYCDGEIAISGKLADGSYAGPEAVVVHGQGGDSITTAVIHHSLQYPTEWPVLPTHEKTILTISIKAPSPTFRVDESKPIVGQGVLFINQKREDISEILSDPVFLATQLTMSLESDDVEPNVRYFGVSTAKVNHCYEEMFERRFESGVWPFIRIRLNDCRSIELEYAASIEYQTRFWIEDQRTSHRVLLGYHSGHFSLPAFRFEEIAWLDRCLHQSPVRAAAILLLMTGCYLQHADGMPTELIADRLSQLHAVQPKALDAMRNAFLDSLVVPELGWRREEKLGWTNNWRYSQRNPQSTMSVLRPEDFAAIGGFFEQ